MTTARAWLAISAFAGAMDAGCSFEPYVPPVATSATSKEDDPASVPATQDCAGPAAAFVTFTRERGAPTGLFRIHSNCLDGSAERLLFSETVPIPMAAASVARVAPDGKRIAYSPPGAASGYGEGLYVLGANGRGRARIVEGPVASFAWRPDSRAVLYAPAPEPSATANAGYPRISTGFPWKLWTADGRTVEVANLRPRNNEEFETDFTWRYLYFIGWAPRDRLLFEGHSLFSMELLVHDLRAGAGTLAAYLPGSTAQIAARAQTASLRTAAIASSPTEECRIVEITGEARVRTLFAAADHRCEGIAWNDEDEIFYGKGTGPHGRISTIERAASGHHVLMSIYRFDLKARREHQVLRSDGTEVYSFQGMLPGKALIVLNESGLAGRPRYILESRLLDGTRPVRLYEGYARPAFIGWIRPIT